MNQIKLIEKNIFDSLWFLRRYLRDFLLFFDIFAYFLIFRHFVKMAKFFKAG